MRAGRAAQLGAGTKLSIRDDFFNPTVLPLYTQWSSFDADNWCDLSIIDNGLAVAASPAPPLALGRAQIQRQFPSNYGDGVSVKAGVLVFKDNTYTAPIAHFAPTGIAGYAGTWEQYLGSYDVSWIGASAYDDGIGKFWYNDLIPGPAPSPGTGEVHEFEVRSVGGYAATFIDGVHRSGPVPIDPAHLGSAIHGMHIQTGSLDKKYVEYLTVSKFIGSLPVLVRPTVNGTPTTNNASSALSIDLSYPSGIVAGEYLVATVVYNNGTPQTPGGWTPWTTANITGGLKMAMYYKVATGSESGSQTFSKTGSNATVAGIMMRMGGLNTQYIAWGSGQGNTSASTNVASPDQLIAGTKKLGLWIAAIANAEDITLPSGYGSVAVTGTGGPAINLVIGSKAYDTVPADTIPGPVGTLGVARTSVAMALYFHPQP